MSEKILFDPEKLAKLEPPFSIFMKSREHGKPVIKSYIWSNKIIDSFFSGNIPDWEIRGFYFFSSENIKHEKLKIGVNHSLLSLKKSKKQYIKSKFRRPYYVGFQKIHRLLSRMEVYHRIRTGEKKYTNSLCRFNLKITPKVSFRLERKGKNFVLKPKYVLNDLELNDSISTRYGFLLLIDDMYYKLKEKDWQVIELVEEKECFTFKEYQKFFQDKLKTYEVDSSGALESEVRKIQPDSVIQVSELGGNLLLFLPRWDYDGNIVEGTEEKFEVFENGKRVIYIRDKIAEQKTLDFLRNAHPNFKTQRSFFLPFKEASKKNWFFNFYQNELKDNFRVTGMDMLGYFRYSEHPIETEFKIKKIFENEVTASFKVKFGKEKVLLKNLQKAVLEGTSYVVLRESYLGLLPEDWMRRYGVMLKYGTIDGDTLTFAKWIFLAEEQDKEYEKYRKIVLPENWMKKWEQWNDSEDILYEKPDTINAELRPYQQKGYEWLNLMAEVNAGTLLADDMGLGKTLQTITSLAYWKKENPKSRFLIVCPASLIYNWKNEFEKFSAGMELFVYHGSGRDFDEFKKSGNSAMITSYAIVRNDFERLMGVYWDAIVLDESHNIKNLKAQQTQAILKIRGKRRILLNGTPIMNSLSDLYPQLSFILPQLFNSAKKFNDEFVKPNKDKISHQHTLSLQMLTRPFILRRTKESAAPDLPQKTESVLWCEMEADQRKAYEEIKKQVKKNILVDIKKQGLGKAKLGVLQGITKLRQVCSSPRLIKEEADFAYLSSIKIDNLIDELTSNLKDNKVIIFTQFLGTMDLLTRAFEEKGIEYRSFSGSTPVAKRMELVDEFQREDSEIQVFLLSLMAGNSGINLTQANYVFLVEPWWNKAIQQQAIDRVHRIGQTQKVFAYNMICKDTIEEKIINLQNKKQKLSEEVITTDENFVKNLTEEDIAFLFE